MICEIGEKLHVVTRRYFDGDLKRHFVGEILAMEGPIARTRGYAFVFNPHKDEYIRRPEERIRIVDLADPGNIVNIIPGDVDLKEVAYVYSDERRLVLTDGGSFRLDVNEFSANR